MKPTTPDANYFIPPQAGALRLAGADRVDYLQRQTTNDLRPLAGFRSAASGPSITTVLTNPMARILDVLHLVPEDDALLALTLPGYAEATFTFLRKRIFFNDKVTLVNASQAVFQALLNGPHAPEALARLGLAPAAPGQFAAGELAGRLVKILGTPGLQGPGFRLVGPSEQAPEFEAALKEGGFERLDDAAFETLRIESGLPAAFHELVEEYTPLEAGLQDAISHTKGCYTGQEVIARQITYDKITRSLVGVRLDGPAAAGEPVTCEDKPAGTLTSFTQSPHFGPVALAILKRPYFAPGTRVTIQSGERIMIGKVCALPFA